MSIPAHLAVNVRQEDYFWHPVADMPVKLAPELPTVQPTPTAAPEPIPTTPALPTMKIVSGPICADEP
jgi:hypothetical protein